MTQQAYIIIILFSLCQKLNRPGPAQMRLFSCSYRVVWGQGAKKKPPTTQDSTVELIHFISVDFTITEKLWGPAASLVKTASFIINTGLDIQHCLGTQRKKKNLCNCNISSLALRRNNIILLPNLVRSNLRLPSLLGENVLLTLI